MCLNSPSTFKAAHSPRTPGPTCAYPPPTVNYEKETAAVKKARQGDHRFLVRGTEIWNHYVGQVLVHKI